jgi:hypothetical protein
MTQNNFQLFLRQEEQQLTKMRVPPSWGHNRKQWTLKYSRRDSGFPVRGGLRDLDFLTAHLAIHPVDGE